MAGMLANFLMANSKGLYPKLSGGSGRKRKRKARVRKAARRSSTTTRGAKRKSKPARLIKGSAAAKRYMAKIRKKRSR